jgi:hypothetical protein
MEYQAIEYSKLYKDVLDENQRALLSRVQQEPTRYGFISTILKDGDWPLTFDAWEADTQAAGSIILTAVQSSWYFCTGFVPPVGEAVLP